MLPANLMYADGPVLPFDGGENIELVVLSVLNPRTIMVIPKVKYTSKVVFDF